MQFHPKEPDIETVCKRIAAGLIDLQPDFQRGEVWSMQKKQRLIDTILRGWVVPPVLLLKTDAAAYQVLDGQQRLAAIRDFVGDKFPVDGTIEPHSEPISSLHGTRFSKLPKPLIDNFNNTALRVYEISDYSPEEPAEIFFRLNQPTMLTSAEKRNAFFGPVRDQVRSIVEKLKTQPHFIKAIGFSNSRMAYDDVIARAAYLLERRSLRAKIAESSINTMYRRTEPIGDTVFYCLEDAVSLASAAIINSYRIRSNGGILLKHNKATFLSWILFFARITANGAPRTLHSFFDHFEAVRQGTFSEVALDVRVPLTGYVERSLLTIYSDRATSRVADVNSILLRDFVISHSWSRFSAAYDSDMSDKMYGRLVEYRSFVERRSEYPVESLDWFEEVTLEFLDEVSWGAVI